MKKKRVAIYARVSTTDQSALMQVEELKLISQQRGWLISHEFIDDGASGASTSRPALDEMVEGARLGKFDLLVVWKLDRLGRSLQHLLKVLDDLSSWGVGFVSLRDAGIDTSTASGRLMLQLLGAFAEFERSMIRERVIAGVRRAQAAGKHCGRARVEMDLRPALALLQQGRGLKQTADILGVSRSTLRRRLKEAKLWVPGEGVQKAGDSESL